MGMQNTSDDQSFRVSGFSYKRLSPVPPEAIPPFADPHLRWLSSQHSPFTRQARSAMVGACLAVIHRHSPALDAEHMLRGILARTSDQLFAAMFASGGVSPAILLAAVEASTPPVGASQVEAIPVAIAACNVVAIARREAGARGYTRIGTGPLLIGLAQDELSLTSKVLAQHGMTALRLREDLAPVAFLH